LETKQVGKEMKKKSRGKNIASGLLLMVMVIDPQSL
jgi:hypothetical protein